MERENPLVGLRYFADACISIGEGIGEGAAECVDRVVQRQVGRDLAAVHQPFGAAADAGAQGADKDLTGCRPGCGQFPDLHTARGGMKQRAGRYVAHLPTNHLYRTVDQSTWMQESKSFGFKYRGYHRRLWSVGVWSGVREDLAMGGGRSPRNRPSICACGHSGADADLDPVPLALAHPAEHAHHGVVSLVRRASRHGYSLSVIYSASSVTSVQCPSG